LDFSYGEVLLSEFQIERQVVNSWPEKTITGNKISNPGV